MREGTWFEFRDENGLNLNRIGALIFLTVLLALPAFRGEFAQKPNFVRLGTAEGDAALRRRADDYLRQTHRLLGERFQEEFYRSAVETRLAGFSAAPEASRSAERRCFDFLIADSDPCADEVFAFLDQFERQMSAPSDDVLYLAGNPLNAYAARLSLSPAAPATRGVFRHGLQTIPISLWAGLAISLFTLVGSVFSAVPPVGGAAGPAGPSFRELFRLMARRLCFLFLLLRGRAVRCGMSAILPRSMALEEKKSVCLLR